MKQTLLQSSLALAIVLLMGCSKEPGFGGNSAITGSAILKVYSEDFSETIEELELADTYVYLSSENSYGYLERVKTAFNGSFEFDNLNAGDYVVYAYSMDTTRASATDIAIELLVTIDSQSESVEAGTLLVATNKATGNSTINGRVMIQSQSNPEVQYPAQDRRVYIMYNDDLVYKTYTRTSFDGYYDFDRLPIGDYRIYAYSQDIDNVSLSASIPVIDSLEIVTNGTDTTLADIIIY